MNILELLEYEEGYRKDAYYCSEGYPTIGIGLKIGPKNASLENYQLSMSKPIAYAYLNEKVEIIKGQLSTSRATMVAYDNCNQARKVILESMCYQLGFNGVCKFKKMLAALERSDFKEAAVEALDSRWAKQTKSRAYRHAQVIETGTYRGTY